MRRALVLAALLLFTPVVRATVLVPADFREVVSGSQVIVYGRVAGIRSEWSDDRRSIDTLVTVEAGTYLKGGPGGTVTFRVPGGEIGRYRNVMIGAPELRAGEEAVFFLRGDGPRIASIFGLNQGLFRVREEDGTGRRLVVLPPIASGDEPERIVRGAAERRPVPLDDFAAQVRAVMAQAGGAR